MQFFKVELKKEFPQLKSEQNPTLYCYITDCYYHNEEAMLPGVLIMPGGGYGSVCKDREGEPIAFHFLRAGYCAFVLEYSVQTARYPEALSEAAAAMLYIRRHAKEWRVNPNNIAVSGFSAGGHLACSLGTLCTEESVLSLLQVQPEEIAPNAMVLGYPVISSDPSFAHIGSIENVSGLTKEESDHELWRHLSLEKHVNRYTPPTYLWHTSEDNCVPVKNSIAFSAALAEKGIMQELHIFPKGWHGLSTGDKRCNPITNPDVELTHAWVDEALRFLEIVWQQQD